MGIIIPYTVTGTGEIWGIGHPSALHALLDKVAQNILILLGFVGHSGLTF